MGEERGICREGRGGGESLIFVYFWVGRVRDLKSNTVVRSEIMGLD